MDTEQLFYTQNGYDRADTGPLTTAMEDYLEMICRLTRTGGYTRISALARELHVQPSSASKMAALLRSGGYLTNERYGCLRLTERALRRAHTFYTGTTCSTACCAASTAARMSWNKPNASSIT